MYSLNLAKHPFKTEVEKYEINDNVTLQEAYESLEPLLPIEHVRCTVNGEVCEDLTKVPPLNAVVTMRVVPEGDGDTWDTVASIATVVTGAAVFVTGMLTGNASLIWWGAGIMASASGVGAAAKWIYNNLSDDGEDEDYSNTYGGSSSSSTWSAITTAYGEHYLAPSFASSDYTTTSDDGETTYLHQLYLIDDQNPDWGTRPIIDSISIGDNALFSCNKLEANATIVKVSSSTFIVQLTGTENTFTEYLADASVGSPISIEGSTRPQNNRSFDLISYSSTTMTLSGDNYVVDDIGADLTFKYIYDAGIYDGVSVSIVDDGDFSGTEYPYVRYESYVGSEISYSSDVASSIYFTTTDDVSEATVTFYMPSGLYALDDDGDTETTSVGVVIKVKEVGTDTWYDSTTVNISNRNTTGSITKAVSLEFPSVGQWLMSFTKTDKDFDTDEGCNTINLYKVNCTKSSDGDTVDPVSSEIASNFVFLAMQITANEQLNGSIDDLNIMLRHEVHAYDETSDSWVPAYSNNPAAIFIDTLLNPVRNRYPIATDVDWSDLSSVPIDWDRMVEWYQYCETEGFTCNGVLTDTSTAQAELELIATTGQAIFVMIDSKYSVVIDKAQDTPVQLFTPRNTYDFSATRTFSTKPDGVRVKYLSADIGYQYDESRLDYDDADGDTYDELSLTYVTSASQAKNFGKYYLNVLDIRQELFTFSTDFEYLVCTVGDRIKFQHDVPLMGLTASRISSVTEEDNTITEIVMDEIVAMEEGYSYGVDVRVEKSTGFEILSLSVVFNSIPSSVLTLSVPQELNTIKRGDLVTFGKIDYVSEDLVITDITTGNDMTATLTCYKYDEAVYDLDNYYEWDSTVGTPASSEKLAYIPSDIDNTISELAGQVDEALEDDIVEYAVNESIDTPPDPDTILCFDGVQLTVTGRPIGWQIWSRKAPDSSTLLDSEYIWQRTEA